MERTESEHFVVNVNDNPQPNIIIDDKIIDNTAFNGFKLNYYTSKDVRNPEIGTSGSLGIDVFTPMDFQDTTIHPGESVLIDMGIHFKIEGPFGLQVNNKSGVSVKKTLIHGAELIDQDYIGELKVHLINVGKYHQTIGPDEKIVQLVPIYKPFVNLVKHEDFDSMVSGFDTERGFGGFGSTGG